MPTPGIYISLASLLQGKQRWLAGVAVGGLIGVFVCGLLASSVGPLAQQILGYAAALCLLAVIWGWGLLMVVTLFSKLGRGYVRRNFARATVQWLYTLALTFWFLVPFFFLLT